MKFEKFEKMLSTIREADDRHSDLIKLGVDLVNFTEPWAEVMQDLFSEVWTEEGVDWLNWFMWENDFGRKDWSIHKTYEVKEGTVIEGEPVKWGAVDEKGNPICFDIKSTWEYIEQYKK